MTDTKYNGYTNYETWLAALWMGNDQGTQEMFDEIAQEYYDEAEADETFSRAERATLNLAERIEAHFEEYAAQWLPDQASFFADAINATLGAVNWYEIAEGYIAETDQEAA